jgi:hypothetical protein
MRAAYAFGGGQKYGPTASALLDEAADPMAASG